MKKYILFLLWGITMSLNAQDNEIKLKVPDCRQEKTKWCWAAASQCVLAYYGNWYRQCDIAEYARNLKGNLENYGSIPCCDSTATDCNKGVLYGTDIVIYSILAHLGNIQNEEIWSGALTKPQINNNLMLQRPFIIVRQKADGNAHAVVGFGKKKDYTIHYMDPTPGKAGGYKELPYEELKYDGIWTWNGSVILSRSIFPDHCYNCKLDADKEELEIDCGGECPSCNEAPEQKNYVTPNSNLPPETRATKKITAGNAAVNVLSGQNVTFITSESGSIVLLPGFEAKSGSNFTAQIKSNSSSNGFTRFCGKYCGDPNIHYVLYREQDHFCLYNLINVYKVEYEFTTVVTGQLIRNGVVNVTHNGTLDLWDLSGSGTSPVNCIATITVYPCNYYSQKLKYTFWIKNKSKSSSDDSDDPENPIPSLSSPANNLTHQNENASPGFTIIPNPNPGVFQIETNFPLSEVAILKVVNSLGATVYDTQNLASNTIHLPISTSGQHFVVLILKEGTVLTQKIMIQR